QFTPIVMNTLGLSASIDWNQSHPKYQPLVNLFQTATDRGDPLAYAPYLIRQPLAGRTAANLLVSEAFADEALPNHSSEALAAAQMLENPIERTQTQMLRFLVSTRDTGTAVIVDPFTGP